MRDVRKSGEERGSRFSPQLEIQLDKMLRGWRWSSKLGVIQLKVIVKSTRGV